MNEFHTKGRFSELNRFRLEDRVELSGQKALSEPPGRRISQLKRTAAPQPFLLNKAVTAG